MIFINFYTAANFAVQLLWQKYDIPAGSATANFSCCCLCF